MTEPALLELPEGDLGHPLDHQRHPAEVLPGVPPATTAGHALPRLGRRPLGPLPPRVAFEGVVGEGFELGKKLRPARHRERGGHADMVQPAFGVVEAEQNGTDPPAILVNPVAGDHTVRRAAVLDLHQGALVGGVRIGQALGDHPVEAGTLELGEPLRRHRRIGGARAQVHRRCRIGQGRHQKVMAGAQRGVEQVAIGQGEEVEGHERGRGLGGQASHARLGGVDALQQ